MLKQAQNLLLMERFRSRQHTRRQNLTSLSDLLKGETVDPATIEPMSRQLERARLLVRSESLTVSSVPPSGTRILESVVGRDDRLPRSFLTVGARTADAVCRISTVEENGETSYGTGFSVAPGLVMTNNHVLPDAGSAARGQADFGLWSDPSGRPAQQMTVRFDPAGLFFTQIDLDFTIVSLDPAAAAAAHDAFGSIDLLPQSGKALIGEAVNVIQHGDGQLQDIAIRNNVIVDVFDDWIHYTSDTWPGASGSPVLNDQWQLAALHHAEFEYSGDTGQTISVNEGVRISSIVRRIQEMSP